MNQGISITFENLNTFLLPIPLDYSSDSSVKEVNKIQENIIANKFAMLRDNIGKGLFDQLSYEDKLFMAETASSINFGRAIDLNNITTSINEYENY